MDSHEFRILGPLEATRNGHAVPLGGARARSLLAVLLVHKNEIVSSDRLIDELWAEAPPQTASTALHGMVSQLRKSLEPDRGQRAEGALLVTRAPGYVLRIDPSAVDATRFEQLVMDGRGALDVGAAGQAARLLREALALWRGRALDGADGTSSAHAEALRLEELRLEAVEMRIDADLALGRDEELIPELEALVEREPLRERLHAQMMLALYRSGRQAEALDRYQHVRRTFRDRLGIEPSPRLRELEQAMLRQDPELDAGLPRLRPLRVVRRRRRRTLAAVLGVGAVVALGFVVTAVVLTRENAPLTGAAGSVVVVDPAVGRVVDTIEVGSGPVAIAFGHGSVWVANSKDDTVSRIDPKTREVVKVIGVPSPVQLAVGPDAVWVAGGLAGTVSRIDPESNDVVAQIDLRGDDPLLPWTVQGITADASSAWVCVGDELVRVDSSTNTVADTLDVPGRALAASVGFGSVWVVTGAFRLLRIEPTTLAITARSSTPGYPVDIVATDEGIVVLTEAAAWLVAPDTARFIRTLPVRGRPAGVADNRGEGVWVSTYDGAVIRATPLAGTSSSTVRVGDVPYALVVGNASLWIALHEPEP